MRVKINAGVTLPERGLQCKVSVNTLMTIRIIFSMKFLKIFILKFSGCPKKRRVRGTCNKKTCIRRIFVLMYSIRKCICVVVKRLIRSEKCCCPKRKRRTWCNRLTGVVTRFIRYYHLADGVCLRYQRIYQHETREFFCFFIILNQHFHRYNLSFVGCDSVLIRVLSCNPKTSKRIIFITTFKRRRCSCQRIVKRIVQPCRKYIFEEKVKCRDHDWYYLLIFLTECRPPRITRSDCRFGQRIRAVIYVYYELRTIADRQICARRTRTFFYEPCGSV